MTTSEKLLKALKAIPGMSVGDAMRYAILAGTAHLFFHVVFKTAMRHRRISDRQANARQIGREILHSVRSLAIFGVVGGMIYFAAMNGWTRFYQPIDKFGWTYYFISIGLMIVLHDAYFYAVLFSRSPASPDPTSPVSSSVLTLPSAASSSHT